MPIPTKRYTIGPDGTKTPKHKPVAPDDPRLNLDHCRTHRNFFRRECLKIATKTRGLQPLLVNSTQRRFLELVASLRSRGIAPRIIVLKSRQVGISTIVEAELFAETLFTPHQKALVLAHIKPAAKNIINMARLFLDELPKGVRIDEVIHNVNELELVNGSRMEIQAVGLDVRSFTAQRVHFSEFAFYEKPRETLIAAMQSVPNDPSSLVVIESTANGVGNKFHEMWVNATSDAANPDLPTEERGWIPLFIPWYEHEEYVARPWFTPEELSAEERNLAHRLKLNLRQLAWRRWCIRVNCDGDEDAFKVEYPTSWQEAFALSGRPIFDVEKIKFYDSMVPPPHDRDCPWNRAKPSEIAWDEPTRKPVVEIIPTGRLRVFKEPHPRHTYVVGADPSEGDSRSDPTPIEVFDQMTFEFVAEWWGRTPPDMLADYAAWLGHLYNVAEIIAEANNQGVYFHGRLIELDYPNIFFRPVSEETVSGEATLKPGYFETNKAKHLLFDTFRKYVRENRGAIYSPGLLGEMRTATYDRREGFTKTKIKPQAGHFIDRVIAAGLCLYAHRGSIVNPLLPLPERELLDAAAAIQLARERDPEGADRLSLDLIGMSAAGLDQILEQRRTDKLRQEVLGIGMER